MYGKYSKKHEKLVQGLQVLVVEDNVYMRKVIRTLLTNVGVKNIKEAADGIDGLESIRTYAPDICIVDWDMPLLNGPELVRIVRSPGIFPYPDVPIIMISGLGERWRIVESARLGVNEFLVKPLSGKSLMDRMMSIFFKPRPAVRIGNYYGPEPRKDLFDPAAEQAAAAKGVAEPTH